MRPGKPLPKRNYVRRTGLALLDGRTAEGRLARQLREGFTAQVGTPTPVETVLIERAIMLSLQISRFDKTAAENNGHLAEWQSNTYLAWSNSLVRTLAQLGLAPRRSTAKRAAGGFDHSSLLERFATTDADAAA